MREAVYAVARRPYLLPGLVLRRFSTHRRRRRDLIAVKAILRAMPPQGGMSPASWEIRRVEWPKFSQAGVTVVMVGPPGQPPRLVLKLPHTPEGVASLRRQQAVLAALAAEPRLDGWRSLVAETVAQGTLAEQFFIVETALPGHSAAEEIHNREARECLQRSAASAIGKLHTVTAKLVTVDAPRLERWVDARLEIMDGVVSTLPAAPRYRAALERIRRELYAALSGQSIATSWIHGDFWPGNLQVDGEGTRVVGLVDWERAAPDELPLHDLMHLLLFTRQQIHKRNEADIVVALGGGICWTPAERALLQAAQANLPGAVLDERPMVLLYWLRQMSSTLSLLPEYRRNRDYLADHVESVLRCL